MLKFNFYRITAMAACLAGGLLELIALNTRCWRERSQRQ
ncbi:hypothetical protein GALL_471290 [mine drainage metagenome]|uniref:Uncharacterized protein n=1 Tax=mine drainage metagenome TaxID=410659 RepID=A0A1J5PKC4_9ZZZZ